MQVMKNMLTSDSNKGPYMKPFFVLLISIMLVGCSSETPPAAPATSSTRSVDTSTMRSCFCTETS